MSETRITGLPISGGVARGRVCLLNERRHDNMPLYRVEGEGKERERERLSQAVGIAIAQVEALARDVAARIGPAEAEIFTAHRMILLDPELNGKMVALIDEEDVNAEVAVARTLDVYEARIQAIDSEYIRERASDIGEIHRRLLDALRDMSPALECASDSHCQRGSRRIVVAEDLTPGMTVELDVQHTIGFVTERGGPTSHAAILARALGIPAVSGVKGIHNKLSCGAEILIDGATGEVVVWPSEATLAEHIATDSESEPQLEAVEPTPSLRVMANISYASEAAEAIEMKAEGIGLYRTEFELIAANRLLDEDEQFDRYAAVVKAMDGRPVTCRLFDIGGDKATPFLEMTKESNPSLGLRGARFLLSRPELVATQARALARASALGPLNVVYPMIVDREQFLSLKAMFVEATSDLPNGALRHGAMFEVPSACLRAKEILSEADFGCIGSNDLIQFLFAIDRDNELVAYDYDPDRSVFWTIISDMAEAARETGRPLTVCGEAVSDRRLLGRFLDAGIETVSVSPRLIPEIRLAGARAEA